MPPFHQVLSEMLLQMPREYADQPLLTRVVSSTIFYGIDKNFIIMFEICLIWQVRELADDEMLHDAELRFE